MGGVNDYSSTPASNTSLNGIAITDAMVPNTIDNAMRQQMADARTHAEDTGGKNVSAGTDTITLATSSGVTGYYDGLRLTFIAGGTNTGAATLNVDSVGAKAVRKGADAALVAGDITAAMPVDVVYDASANSAAGAFMLLNPYNGSQSFQPLDADLTTLAAAFTTASASGAASLKFAEDTDNGSNAVTLQGAASTADVTVTLPAATDTLVGKATTDILSNKTLVDPAITGCILEDIFTITDGAAFEIDPGNGSIQQITLGASRTPAATNFANGESVTLMVDDGSAFAITWTTVDVNWTGGSAPTLATSGWTVVELWKVGNQIFGAHVGDVAA